MTDVVGCVSYADEVTPRFGSSAGDIISTVIGLRESVSYSFVSVLDGHVLLLHQLVG